MTEALNKSREYLRNKFKDCNPEVDNLTLYAGLPDDPGPKCKTAWYRAKAAYGLSAIKMEYCRSYKGMAFQIRAGSYDFSEGRLHGWALTLDEALDMAMAAQDFIDIFKESLNKARVLLKMKSYNFETVEYHWE